MRAIRTWQLGQAETLQNLDGFVAYPVLDDGWDAFIIEDLNFDGYRDLRLMADRPAGPNIPYLYWLFDPQQSQFERNEALEQVTAPEVDEANQQLISNWRSGAATFGTDTWQWGERRADPGAPGGRRLHRRRPLHADRSRARRGRIDHHGAARGGRER